MKRLLCWIGLHDWGWYIITVDFACDDAELCNRCKKVRDTKEVKYKRATPEQLAKEAAYWDSTKGGKLPEGWE